VVSPCVLSCVSAESTVERVRSVADRFDQKAVGMWRMARTVGLLLVISCSAGEDETPGVRGQPLSADSVEARRAEVEAWVLAGHERRGHQIVLTETTAGGTVIDWVDRDSTDAAGVEPPPPLDLPPRPDGVEVAEMEPVSGPPGAVPYVRPRFDPYVDGESDATSVDEFYRTLPHGNPNAINNRLYAQLARTVTNYGVFGAINGRWSSVQAPQGSNFVINELASFCRSAGGSVSDLVGVAVGRHPAVYGLKYVLLAEYAVGGVFNWITGGGNDGFYTQSSATYAPGMEITNDSTSGGTQYETPLAWVLYSSPQQWWLYYNGNAVGYINAGNLGSLSTSACFANHYGEAYFPSHTTLPWMNADMASGVLPTGTSFYSNYGSRGYIRLPSYYAALNAGSITRVSGAANATDSACYGALNTTNGSPSGTWNPTLFFGGPGGGGSCL
jgi:neprosin-like protein